MRKGSIAGMSGEQDITDSSLENEQNSPEANAVNALFADPSFLTQLSRARDASEALQLISTALQERAQTGERFELMPSHVIGLFDACLERNSIDLCLSIYRQMTSTPKLSESQDDCLAWPTVNLEVMCLLVLGLARRIRVSDALNVMRSLSFNGTTPDAEEIVFGKVINSPVPPFTPLTLVQPQEGVKKVACATSRYLFEVFSGEVTSVRSDSLESSNDLLVTAARFLKLWKKPEIRAIHEMIITTPSGSPRSFRFATEFSDVPAKLEDRVSIICAPAENVQRNYGIFAPIPPSTRPGEAMAVTNHNTSVTVPLLRAPPGNKTESIPSWILPAAVILAGSDVASSFVDPNLPLIGAASVAAIGVSVALGNTALLPRLKQLPENRLGGETLRQELLRQHQILISKIDELVKEASNDIRSLAKLWQLESKMTSVDATGKYEARLQRIDKARQSLEKRLLGRMELMHGYRRVANMIEIEVEMDVDVPAAELEGIEEQLIKLEEVENLQEEMEYQIEAQDEVERLLRSTE